MSEKNHQSEKILTLSKRSTCKRYRVM